MMLLLARVAVRTVPTARLLAWASRPPRQVNRFAASQATAMVTWAVDRVGTGRWMPASCLPRALAAQTMLRRRGVPSRLCLGVAKDEGALTAHAWIELARGSAPVDSEVERFTRIAEFG